MQKEVGVALTARHAKHLADGASSQIPRQTPLALVHPTFTTLILHLYAMRHELS